MSDVPMVAESAVRDRVIPAGGGRPVDLRLLLREAWTDGGSLHAVARWSLADLVVRTTVVVTGERAVERAEIELYDTLRLVWRPLDALRPSSPSSAEMTGPMVSTGAMMPARTSFGCGHAAPVPAVEAHHRVIDVEGDLLALGATILQAACVIEDDEDE